MYAFRSIKHFGKKKDGTKDIELISDFNWPMHRI